MGGLCNVAMAMNVETTHVALKAVYCRPMKAYANDLLMRFFPVAFTVPTNVQFSSVIGLSLGLPGAVGRMRDLCSSGVGPIEREQRERDRKSVV